MPDDDGIRVLLKTAQRLAAKFGGGDEAEDIASEAIVRRLSGLRDDETLSDADLHILQREICNVRHSWQRSAERRKTIRLAPNELPLSAQRSDDPRLGAFIDKEAKPVMIAAAISVIEEVLNREPDCGKPILTKRARAIVLKKFDLEDLIEDGDLDGLPENPESQRKAEYRAMKDFLDILDQEIQRRMDEATDRDRAIWRDLYRRVRGVTRPRPSMPKTPKS